MHPNEQRLREGYELIAKGDLDTLRKEYIAEDIAWHVPGRNPQSGDYHGVDEVFGFLGKIFERSGGTFRLEIHDVLANDEHGIVLAVARAERDGKTLEDRVVHVFHLREGKMTEYWGHPGDQHGVDEFWS
jgi:hypothetical protein